MKEATEQRKDPRGGENFSRPIENIDQIPMRVSKISK